MQHHHSQASRSLQPAIDSLPSISDLSLNLISFSPPPRRTSMGLCTCMCLSDCAFMVCTYCTHVCLRWWEFFSRLPRVKRVPNQALAVIIAVFLCTSLENHSLQDPFLWKLSSVMTKLPVQTVAECGSSPPDGLLLFASAPHLTASFKSAAPQL